MWANIVMKRTVTWTPMIRATHISDKDMNNQKL